MTGRDHTDALVEALRQPALPTEQVGEAAAIASMLGALTGAAAPRGLRSRKGAVIVAITAASLGVGGLAAAGPGVFPRVLDFGRAALPEQVRPEIATEAASPAVSLPDAVTSNPATPPAPNVVRGGVGAAQPADPGVSPAVPAAPQGAEPNEPDEVEVPTTSCVDDEHAELVVDAAQTVDGHDEAVPEAAKPDCGSAPNAGPPDSTPGNDDPGTPEQAVPPTAVQPAGGPASSTGTKTPTTPVEPRGPVTPEAPPPAPTPPVTTSPVSTPPVSTPPATTPPAATPPAATPPTPAAPSGPAQPPTLSVPPTRPTPGAPADPGAPDRAGKSVTETRATGGQPTSVAGAGAGRASP